jgi:hypothetical protein
MYHFGTVNRDFEEPFVEIWGIKAIPAIAKGIFCNNVTC